MTAHVVVLAAAAVLLSVPAAQGAAPYWFSGWKNTYDKYFYATCPVTQAITGLYSVHHNRYGTFLCSTPHAALLTCPHRRNGVRGAPSRVQQ